MNPADSIIVENAFEKAEDFLNYLQPREDRWHPKSGSPSPWVFRGQGNTKWGLTPSAWRTPRSPWFEKCVALNHQSVSTIVTEKQKEMGDGGPKLSVDCLIQAGTQFVAEVTAIDSFLSLADELGEAVPGTPETNAVNAFGGVVTGVFSAYMVPWPDDPNHDLFGYKASQAGALAQHHGVPTRLMDWTMSSLKAAFFSADGSQNTSSDGHLAVWALRLDILRHPEFRLAAQPSERHGVLFCPRNQLSYLHYQDALFIFPEFADIHLVRYRKRPSLEEFMGVITPPNLRNQALLKMTLPLSEREKLLDLLWRERITKAHLMRTLDRVAETIQHRFNKVESG